MQFANVCIADSGSCLETVTHATSTRSLELKKCTPSHPLDHAVWKTFCTICPLQRAAAASSSLHSPSLSRQPSAPRLSSACARVLAPGIGIVGGSWRPVPWCMHQLMATWVWRGRAGPHTAGGSGRHVSQCCSMWHVACVVVVTMTTTMTMTRCVMWGGGGAGKE